MLQIHLGDHKGIRDLIAAGGAKLLWPRELGAVRYRRLAGFAAAASTAISLAGLVITGHDGRMATYGAMVLGCAAALWWAGLRPRRSSS